MVIIFDEAVMVSIFDEAVKMAKFDEKSILKTDMIRKVLQNEQDYTFQDFHFKVVKPSTQNVWISEREDFDVEVYNFDVLILKIHIDKDYKWDRKGKGKGFAGFIVDVRYFNPQTNNDVQSINHIIATFKSLQPEDKRHEDKGNCAVLNNQYIYRCKDNYYTYTKIWKKGDIESNNFDVDLSHEFATNEYISYVKKLYGFKMIQRRTLKKEIKEAINKACSREKKKKLYEKL